MSQTAERVTAERKADNGGGDFFEGNGSPSSIQAIVKAEVDLQIATAKKFPRSVQRARDNAIGLATMDLRTAESCFYKLKRKDKSGREVFIEGPSIRCAEIVASCWGNIRWGSRVIGEDEKFVTTQGVCHDLENNVSCSVEIRRRITTREGHRYGDDMITMTTNAASSIARRNALNSVVPKVIVDAVWQRAKEVAVGKSETLSERRQKAFATFAKMNVSTEQLLVYLGKPDGRPEDITGDDLISLLGVYNAIKDGDTTVDDEFPPIKSADDQKPPQPPADGTSSFGLKGKQSAGATAAATVQQTPAENPPQEPAQPQQQQQTAPPQDAAAPANAQATDDAEDEEHRREQELARHQFETGGDGAQQQQEQEPPQQQEPPQSPPPSPPPPPTAPAADDVTAWTWDRMIDYASTKVPQHLGLKIIDIKQQLIVAIPKKWERLTAKDKRELKDKLDAGTFAWKPPRGASTGG